MALTGSPAELVAAVRRARRRLLRGRPGDAVRPPDEPGVAGPGDLPAQLTDSGSRRPLAAPTGWTLEEVRDLLSTISIEDAPAGELQAYLNEDFERFLHTWQLVRGLRGEALEIGANPYFTTVLLRELSELRLTLTNSFRAGAHGVESQRIRYSQERHGIGVDEELRYHCVNVEIDPFPFDDRSFDVVLFCEVVEHLLLDPVVALAEIARVLRDDGVLVLTTPNVARLENVGRLAAGVNLYDPYSGYGPYGRHNREYTRHEVFHLLGFCGFEVVEHFTADVHAHRTSAFADPAQLEPLVRHRLDDLGQYLFFKAVKRHPPRPGRPVEIYRSMAGVDLVPWS